MHIWKNKVAVQNPLLCEEDGPVYQLRRWYEQFYVDEADVVPEMVERFEFEVDTTKANEYWHEEVAENLRKKADETPRPGTRSSALMVSFAPTSPETLEDQRLYTQARLVEVACLDCLAQVRVKKNSEHHTSIQWDAESLAHCAEFSRTRPSPRDGPIRVGCSRLRSSIDQAVKDGDDRDRREMATEHGY